MTIADDRSLREANTIDDVALPIRLRLIEVAHFRARPILQLSKNLLPPVSIDFDGTHARERRPIGDDLRWRDRPAPFGHHVAAHRFSTRSQTVLDNAPCSFSPPQRADADLLQELEAAATQSLLHAITVAKHSPQHQPTTWSTDSECLAGDVFGVQEMNHTR